MRSWIGLVHLSTCDDDVDRGGGTIGVFLCRICSLSPPIVLFMTADGFSGAVGRRCQRFYGVMGIFSVGCRRREPLNCLPLQRK